MTVFASTPPSILHAWGETPGDGYLPEQTYFVDFACLTDSPQCTPLASQLAHFFVGDIKHVFTHQASTVTVTIGVL